MSDKPIDVPAWQVRAHSRILESELAECFRLSGADPAGREDWCLAKYAVGEVMRLRKERDEQRARAEKAEAHVAWLRPALERMLPQAEGCWQHHYGENPEGGPVPGHIAMAYVALAATATAPKGEGEA